jgi:hypothetical protein
MALIADGAEFNWRLKAPERKTSVGIGASSSAFDHVFDWVAKYDTGTGSNKIDAVYSSRTSGTQTLDLRGSLTSVLDGSTVSFPIVNGVFIKNLSTTTLERLDVGAGSNPFITWLLATGEGRSPSGFFCPGADRRYATRRHGDVYGDRAVGTPSWEILIRSVGVSPRRPRPAQRPRCLPVQRRGGRAPGRTRSQRSGRATASADA